MELEEDSETPGNTACDLGGRVFGKAFGRAGSFALKARARARHVGVFENEMVFERCLERTYVGAHQATRVSLQPNEYSQGRPERFPRILFVRRGTSHGGL